MNRRRLTARLNTEYTIDVRRRFDMVGHPPTTRIESEKRHLLVRVTPDRRAGSPFERGPTTEDIGRFLCGLCVEERAEIDEYSRPDGESDPATPDGWALLAALRTVESMARKVVEKHAGEWEYAGLAYALHRVPGASSQDPSEGAEPHGSAPVSYVTGEGLVRLPRFVMNALGLPHGGGVVFYKHKGGNEGRVQMVSNATAVADLGWDTDDVDDKEAPE